MKQEILHGKNGKRAYLPFGINLTVLGCWLITCIAFLVTAQLSAQAFVHPGLSHKLSDLERMKYNVAANKEPWRTSFQNLSLNQYASYTYAVRGNGSTTLNVTDGVDYDKFKYDGLAAYYNSLMWYITGDVRHAQKCVQIFNAWKNLKHITSGGTLALDAGRVIWKMLEGAEIIKNTYSGWSATDIDAFKAMMVYPGYSTTTEPTAAINSQDATFYWYMYNGDYGRHGNQGIFAMRGILAMGVFMDNRVMYDRALRYLRGQTHRPDDLPYVSGPTVTSPSPSTSNQYYNESNIVAPYIQNTYQDYGYDDQIQNYIWENGQIEESSRDQGHSIGGVSNVLSICEIAWSQGDDVYSILDNRPLLGLEYVVRYNASYNYVFPDQTSPWEPTVASGEFIRRTDRSGRWESLAINPWTGSDLTSLTRGKSFKTDQAPLYEMTLAHYRDRLMLDPAKYKWSKRADSISRQEFGYEQQGFQVDHPGFGGLTFHRPALSPGDPITFASGAPVYRMNTLPAVIEAENFDYFIGGGQGKTYNDLSSGNTGGQYRTGDSVDIETCTEGGYNLTSLEAGEWVNYTIEVPATGHYRLDARYAALAGGGTVRIDFDGVNKSGNVSLPFGGTGSAGSQNWKTFTVIPDTVLQAGVQSMRVFIGGTSNVLQLNRFEFTRLGSLAAQTITFPAISIKTTTDVDFDPGATASSGLPVTYASSNPAVATIVNNQVHIVGAGTTTITASQGGNSVFAAAGDVSRSLAVTGIAAGDYFSSGNISWNGGTWNIADGAGGIASTTTTPPTASDNVHIITGHTVTLATTAGTAKNLTIQAGATLLQQAALTVAQTTVVSGTETMANTLTINDLTIDNPGVLASTTPPAGSVSSLITNSPAIITVNGTLGAPAGSAITTAGSGIRIFVNGTGSTTFTGTGTTNIARFSPNSGNSNNQAIVIDMDMELRNYAGNGVASLTLQNGNGGGSNKSLTITEGKTVKLNGSGLGAFHGTYWPTYGNTSASFTGTTQVYNINGTLDCSTAQFNLATNTQSASNAITVNVNGTLKLGSTVRMFRYLSTQSIAVTVADNGVVDGSTAALNLNNTTSGGSINTSNFTGTTAVATGLGGVPLTGNNPTVGSYTFSGSGGSGYTAPPAVVFNGTASTAASAIATLTNGTVTGITVLSSGTYSVAPTAVSFVGGGVPTQWFAINGPNAGGTISQQVSAGTASPFWIGTSITSYNPVTVTPTASSLFTVNIKPSNTPAGLPDPTHSLARTWDITPATPSATTLSFGYSAADGNTAFDINRYVYLMHYNNGSSAWETLSAATAPATGMGTDKTATFGGITSFSPFTITNDLSQQTQTITFPPIPVKTLSAADFDPGATASSGLTVIYTSSNTAVATIVNGKIHIVGVGTSTITASQPGNASYVPATDVSQTLTVSNIEAGDYFSSGTMDWNSGTWNISDGAGGIASTTTTAPTAAKNVHILTGHTVTLATTAGVCNNLTVQSGATLQQNINLTASGVTNMNGTLTSTSTYTANNTLNISGTWTMATLTTAKDVMITSTGVLKSTSVAGGTVYTLNFGGTSPTITINGQLGGASAGATGEGIRMYTTGTGTTTFTGTGKVFLARFQPNNTANQDIVMDIDMNFNTSVNTATGFTLMNNTSPSAGSKSFTINAGKTLKLSNANCGFHNIASATAPNTNIFGNMTYNVNGTLDVITAPFVLYSNNSTTSPAPTQQVLVNVGSAGVLKLGANVRMQKAISTQTVAVTVADGGVVDGSTIALNLTTAPVSANGTATTDRVWFSLSPNAVYKRLVTASIATPLWIGPSATSYNPLTVTPATGTVFTVNVKTGNTPAGLANASDAINRTWDITPATASSTTVTFGYNDADKNSTCNPAGNMYLAHYKAATTFWEILGTAATPVAGAGTDRMVTFTGVTGFSPFTVTNNNIVLPVSLQRFVAVPQVKSVMVSWVTVNENNTKEFQILRSTDGRNFQAIGTKASAGNSTTTRSYEFADAAPLTGISYYQLKTVDQDGKITMSAIVQVRFDQQNEVVSVINPVYNHLLTVMVKSNGTPRFNLYDYLGRKLTISLLSQSGTVYQFRVNGSAEQAAILNVVTELGSYSKNVLLK